MENFIENRTEKLEITISRESELSPQLMAEFIENFNNLQNENTKLRLTMLVKDLIRLQKAK